MAQPIRVASPPPKPLLIFDGDCGFCRRWVARWQRATGGLVDYLPYQDESIAAKFPEIPRADFERAVGFIRVDGTVYSGAEAVFRSLAEAGKERWLLKLYERYPGFSELAELLYEEVAEHRAFLSKLDRIYFGPGTAPVDYTRTRWLFLRGLALIYLAAFWSLGCQIQGLSGSQGIVPAQKYMNTLRQEADAAHLGISRYYIEPTLAWWNASDRCLQWQCNAGIGLSLLLLLGIAPAPVLFLLWALYLSLTTVCAPFMDFQWDILLLETGFLAILFAPWQLVERPSRQSAPSTLVVFLLRWLMFRLMLESGCVKLLSGDPSWWNLSALRVHYETQPLPTWIGWYAHQLPGGIQSFCCAVMFAIELVVPVFIFSGRRWRILAAAIFAVFQVLILLTGNYTFFNWLTILLCVPLLDDRIIKWPARKTAATATPSRPCRRWPRTVLAPLTLMIVLVTTFSTLARLRVPQTWAGPLVTLVAWLEPLRSFNSYGLFAVMTPTRPEIVIEGSNDGKTWKPYEFRYKPGDVKKKPAFVAPYQPRLDWQMWFAALGTARENPWFLNFEVKLLQNSPPVLGLMGHNPFPRKPPRYVRALLYEYHFTDIATRRATGQWWRRQYLGVYFPPISLNAK